MAECRAEAESDVAAIREVIGAAFGRSDEADLVDALRREPEVWIPGLSVVATDAGEGVVGYALLTRCRVGGHVALALAPCAVAPGWQNRGVGTEVTAYALSEARERVAENLVVVLGHPEFYPRFGFRRASDAGIAASFEVPDEALMYLSLDPDRPIPSGVIEYPPAFGV
ncbi:GNAT family N-acetyltransferase [Gordonia sp. SID5947]|uniref:GNAT family N-acetyltransferase n=1 Tax=Gordonia sp. SID5947 TaxID=2690315 RepID=UPI00136E1E3C|nr:N-acetyltransferase [Gordonia sp. SID5947]MYR06225.1 GNAT family N-acetyltransferase [Gordonia sp. SID5947]